MNYKNLFYFDIETVSKYRNLIEFEKNDNRGYHLFIKKIKRKSFRFEDWKKEFHIVYKEKSSIIPEYGKIVVVTMGYFKNDEFKLKSIYNDNEEILIKEVHKIFTNISNNTTFGLCGYYIKGFDIPWLNKKMLKYGLKLPNNLKMFNIKPWNMNVYDLSDMWTNGTIEKSSFDEMLYELNIPSPKDNMSGELVNEEYWINDNLIGIKEYCEEDVKSCVSAAKILMDKI